MGGFFSSLLESEFMAVLCYRIESFKVGQSRPVAVTIDTYTATPAKARPDRLLRLISRSVTVLSPGMYECAGTVHGEVEEMLTAHLAPTVTVAELADLAVCLDWYQIPPIAGHGDWSRTKIGQLVHDAKYDAKYKARSAARAELAVRCAKFVLAHPVMRRADLVLAMPGSGLGSAHVEAVPQWLADAVTRALRIPQDGSLRRVHLAEHPQKDLRTLGDKADLNQEGTMAASGVRDRRVLLLDDTMAHGSSVREACRALTAAGASLVYSLTMAKDASGRRGYDFDLSPDNR